MCMSECVCVCECVSECTSQSHCRGRRSSQSYRGLSANYVGNKLSIDVMSRNVTDHHIISSHTAVCLRFSKIGQCLNAGLEVSD